MNFSFVVTLQSFLDVLCTSSVSCSVRAFEQVNVLHLWMMLEIIFRRSLIKIVKIMSLTRLVKGEFILRRSSSYEDVTVDWVRRSPWRNCLEEGESYPSSPFRLWRIKKALRRSCRAMQGEGGVGGVRTLVQTKNPNVFYMLSFWLIVGCNLDKNTRNYNLAS